MSNEEIIKIPDLGGASSVDVIEILVKPGDVVEKDTSLITLESDKASMEIPSPKKGKVISLKIKVGDKVSEGDEILILAGEEHKTTSTPVTEDPVVKVDEPAVVKSETINKSIELTAPITRPALHTENSDHKDDFYAGPAVRRMARELGVALSQVSSSGKNGRITILDLQNFIKNKMQSSSQDQNIGTGLPSMPIIDFSQFGTINLQPLSKIKKITGVNLQRAWILVPQVTHFDEADITELEAFRVAESAKIKENYKITILAFTVKAIAHALQKFPQFNSSLDATGENLILKNYYNIGIAVDTKNGLVVPVIKNVNQLSISEIAIEMSRLSAKARDKGLSMSELSGGNFTISSLGGIGGKAFTPLVNAPEVAILGLSRSSIQPVYKNGQFEPRMILPLALSYDHRVIDGAEAARFTRFIAELLTDVRKILL